MRTRLISLMAAAALATVCCIAPALAQSLTGKVSSAAEGANGSENLEGVVISAKKGIVIVSVVSNAKGEFSFPAGKLGAGDYALSIRAAGYDLEAPTTVTITGDKPASLDLKLTKTKNLAAQLSNLEWILSVPGTDAEKRALTGCTNCHTVERIVTSKYTAEEMLGRFDTKTLEHKSFKVPLQRDGWPTGALDLETDPQGDLWLGLMFQSGTAKFDVKTEQFQMFSIPQNMIKPDSQTALIGIQNWTVDNKIWIQDPARRGVYRINVSSGETELFEPFANGPGSPYTIQADKENNLYFLNFGGTHIGRIDAKSGQMALYPTPTRNSRPRRGRLDDQGRLWFAEFFGERVGMFDTKTEKFQEWEVPGKFFAPYDAAPAKDGHLWTAGMNADRILRLNLETGKITEYPLPHQTNVRRVFVDNNTTPPTLWVGNNH